MGQEYSVGESAIIYIITFGICLTLFSVSIQSVTSKNVGGKTVRRFNKLGLLFCILSILSISILAGLRSDSVGADTPGYGVQSFTSALRKTSFFDYLAGRTEYSFYGLAFLTSRFTNNVAVWLGLLELLTFAPVVYIIYKEKKDILPMMAVSVYLFKFYNYSLCIMRQSLACSFVLLSVYFFQKKKYWHFVLFSLITLGIHSTAFIGLVANILITLFLRKKEKGNKVLVAITVVLSIVIVFLPRICELIMSKGLLPSYFVVFFDSFIGHSVSVYGLFEIVFRLMLLIPIIIVLKDKTIENSSVKHFLISSAVGCIMYIVCDVTWGINTVYRITQYFDYYFIFSIPYITNALSSKFKTRKDIFVFKSFVMLIVFIYWLIVYLIMPGGIGFMTEHYSFRVIE